MIFVAIDKKGESYYTYMGKVFAAIDNKQKEYNWLLTDCDCYPANSKTYAMLCQEYCWISGDDLTVHRDARMRQQRLYGSPAFRCKCSVEIL